MCARAQGRRVTGAPGHRGAFRACYSLIRTRLPAGFQIAFPSLHPTVAGGAASKDSLPSGVEVTSQWEVATRDTLGLEEGELGPYPAGQGMAISALPAAPTGCGLPLPHSLYLQPLSPAALCPLRMAQDV